MLHGRLEHVGETLTDFRFWAANCTKMCLAVGLHLNMLGSYSAPSDPLGIIRGTGGKERKRKGFGIVWRVRKGR